MISFKRLLWTRSTGLAAALLTPFASMGIAYAAVQSKPPFTLVSEIDIPHVPWGPYADHMAVDVSRRLLYVTPQAAHEVAVVSLNSSRVIRVIPGIKNPHSVYYSRRYNRLVVTDGGNGEIKFFNAKTLNLEKTISAPGADGLAPDRRSHMVVITYGGDDVGRKSSSVALVNVSTEQEVGTIQVTSPELESPQIDPANDLLYVELPRNDSTAVISMVQKRVIAIWQLPKGRHPFASAIDSQRGLLFIGSRDTDMTGTVSVVDIHTGRLLTSAPIGSWVDSMTYDSQRRRLYLSTGVGYLDTFLVASPTHLINLGAVPTAVMAKTSLYSARLNFMFVMVPHLGDTPAKVLVFRPSHE